MRLPLEGLVCALIAAGCSTNKTPETVDSTTLATSDTTVTTQSPDPSDPMLASSEDTSTANTADTGDAEATTAHAETSTAHATVGEPPERTHGTDTSNTEPNAAPADTKPDNTKINKRDTDSAALTPIDQGENESDLKVTQKIRQAVMADGSLSFTAKNVKIITVNGKVTLRGPVKTAAERTSIDGAARKVAGAGMVDNQLELAP